MCPLCPVPGRHVGHVGPVCCCYGVLWPSPCGKPLLLLDDHKTITHGFVLQRSLKLPITLVKIFASQFQVSYSSFMPGRCRGWRCGGCMTRRHSNTTIDQFKSAWRKSPSLPPWVRAAGAGGEYKCFHLLLHTPPLHRTITQHICSSGAFLHLVPYAGVVLSNIIYLFFALWCIEDPWSPWITWNFFSSNFYA